MEPNVIIAGLEAAVAIWTARAALLGEPLIPCITSDWRWSYVLVAIAALLGIVLLGLAVEGVAGALAYLTTRPLRGHNKGQLRSWYQRATDHPGQADWLAAQRWIWKSAEASHEFARRRTRILVSRNTTCVLVLLTIALAVAIVTRLPIRWGLLLVELVSGAGAVYLFGWVWVRANWAYHRAVTDASAIGPP